MRINWSLMETWISYSLAIILDLLVAYAESESWCIVYILFIETCTMCHTVDEHDARCKRM